MNEAVVHYRDRLGLLEAGRDGNDHRETTVTAITMRWRLFHLGNFAADYTRRFGEAPSATLRVAPPVKKR